MYTVFHENYRMVATWTITQLLSDDVAGLSASIVAVSRRVFARQVNRHFVACRWRVDLRGFTENHGVVSKT